MSCNYRNREKVKKVLNEISPFLFKVVYSTLKLKIHFHWPALENLNNLQKHIFPDYREY